MDIFLPADEFLWARLFVCVVASSRVSLGEVCSSRGSNGWNISALRQALTTLAFVTTSTDMNGAAVLGLNIIHVLRTVMSIKNVMVSVKFYQIK